VSFAPLETLAPASDASAHTAEVVGAAAECVRERFDRAPDAAIVLGTGLGGLAKEIDVEVTIPYAEIPGFPRSTVESHAGQLLCGRLGGKTVVAMQGRFHRYEGYTLRQVTFPVRVLRALGAETLIVSNAAGVMNPFWNAGEVMLIADHINLQGDNPLSGPNDERLGVRFPDMSAPYDAELCARARAVALEQRIVLREGVYVAITGPALETRAEYRMLRTLGADVVGMSTVPEVIVAVHAGMRVLGFSIMTDKCLPDALEPVELTTIIANAGRAEPMLTAVVRGVLEGM
jgi:purine-nucleoside phosphorylase